MKWQLWAEPITERTKRHEPHFWYKSEKFDIDLYFGRTLIVVAVILLWRKIR